MKRGRTPITLAVHFPAATSLSGKDRWMATYRTKAHSGTINAMGDSATEARRLLRAVLRNKHKRAVYP